MKSAVALLSLVYVAASLPFFGNVGIPHPPNNMTTTPLNITALITGFGYPCEEYEAYTSDGWVLKIQRIPPLKSPAPVVFFQHGLLDSAAGICLNGPPESLPFILHDHGYDVFLGNNRGNKVSVQNLYYNDTQPQYWNFSFDEMGSIDLPTQLNYVLNLTNANTISYIGHSEGTTQAFIGFTNQNLTSRVNVFIALAPIIMVGNTGSLLLRDMSDAYLDVIAMDAGIMKFEFTDQEQEYLMKECAADIPACYLGLELLFGPSNHINTTALPADTFYFPAATSMKNMAHWFQWVRSGKYCMYDYGPQGNMIQYGQKEPPNYNVQDIPKNFPIVLMSGGNDYLGDPADVASLTAQLNTAGRLPPMQFFLPTYAHADFILAFDAMNYLYPEVLNVLAQFSQMP